MDTNEQTTGTPASLDAYLKDPLSLPEGTDLEALAAGQATAPATDGQQGTEAVANEQGGKGDAPGTDATATDQEEGGEPAGGAKPQEQEPAGVASKDGKHVIPYEELKSTRERAARAEIVAQELTAKLESLQHEIETGKASKTRDISDIVDEEVLAAIREETPEVASVIDKLIERNQQLAEQAHSAQASTVDQARESRVQAVVAVEDAINAVPKLAHVRATDPATFTAIADLDTMLGKQGAWKDKPLAERFGAAVRMYEAANGAIDLPGTGQKPADTDARVRAAVAKAAAASDGPSTLSDIPGGEPAAESSQDALTALSSSALTERFMSMSPDQIEAELARLS